MGTRVRILIFDRTKSVKLRAKFGLIIEIQDLRREVLFYKEAMFEFYFQTLSVKTR